MSLTRGLSDIDGWRTPRVFTLSSHADIATAVDDVSTRYYDNRPGDCRLVSACVGSSVRLCRRSGRREGCGLGRRRGRIARWEWRRVSATTARSSTGGSGGVWGVWGWCQGTGGQAGRVVAMHRAGGRERGRRQQTVRVATGSGGHPVLGRPGHSVATPRGRLLSAGRRITAGAARVGGRPVGGQVMPFASRGWMTVEGLCWRGRGVVGPVPSGSTVPAVGSGRSSDDRVDDRTTLRSVGETGPGVGRPRAGAELWTAVSSRVHESGCRLRQRGPRGGAWALSDTTRVPKRAFQSKRAILADCRR